MNSCQLMFPGVRSSLVFSGFGISIGYLGKQNKFRQLHALPYTHTNTICQNYASVIRKKEEVRETRNSMVELYYSD